MAMMIMNNAAAAMTLGELNKNISQVGKQLKKLSSGQRIVGAGDDASGYSISEKMRVRIRALGQNERTAFRRRCGYVYVRLDRMSGTCRMVRLFFVLPRAVSSHSLIL